MRYIPWKTVMTLAVIALALWTGPYIGPWVRDQTVDTGRGLWYGSAGPIDTVRHYKLSAPLTDEQIRKLKEEGCTANPTYAKCPPPKDIGKILGI